MGVVSSGFGPLDGLLPAGGFRRGSLVEWLAGGAGSGAASLALEAARRAAGEEGTVVIIDRQGLFYPPAAAGAGLDLGRLFVVRPTSDEDQAWALDQVLRCRGVAAAWCCVEEQDGSSEGTVSIRQRRSIRQGGAAKARPTWRRWQLAAEASGVLGLFLRSAAARDEPCWADVRLLVEPVARQANADASRSRRSRVEVLRSRAAAAGGAVELNVELNLAARQDATQPERVTGPQERMASPQERMASSNVQRGKLPDETRAVHLASPLAAAKTGRRSRRA